MDNVRVFRTVSVVSRADTDFIRAGFPILCDYPFEGLSSIVKICTKCRRGNRYTRWTIPITNIKTGPSPPTFACSFATTFVCFDKGIGSPNKQNSPDFRRHPCPFPFRCHSCTPLGIASACL